MPKNFFFFLTSRALPTSLVGLARAPAVSVKALSERVCSSLTAASSWSTSDTSYFSERSTLPRRVLTSDCKDDASFCKPRNRPSGVSVFDLSSFLSLSPLFSSFKTEAALSSERRIVSSFCRITSSRCETDPCASLFCAAPTAARESVKNKPNKTALYLCKNITTSKLNYEWKANYEFQITNYEFLFIKFNLDNK